MNNIFYEMIFRRKSFHIFRNVGNEKISKNELNDIQSAYSEFIPLNPGIKTAIRIVEYLKAEYDYRYIIIDCMPSLGMLTINALACADSVLITVQAAYLPVNGLSFTLKELLKNSLIILSQTFILSIRYIVVLFVRIIKNIF